MRLQQSKRGACKRKMKLKNTTDIPIERLTEIVAFCKPTHLPTSTFTIEFRGWGNRGSSGYCAAARHRPFILVRLGRSGQRGYPYFKNFGKWKVIDQKIIKKVDENTGKEFEYLHREFAEKRLPNPQGYISYLALTREEELVNTVAYELRHFWQSNHLTKRDKVWGTRKIKYSERDASAYGIRKMRMAQVT